jgi:hypothetical protein
LEKLVIHKSRFPINLDQFKGNKKYYQTEKTIEAKELAALLEEESQTLNANLNFCDFHEVSRVNPILTDAELEHIMDRRPCAYELQQEVVKSARFQLVREHTKNANSMLSPNSVVL